MAAIPTIPLKEALQTSGEVNGIVIGENIKYEPADLVEAEGMLLRIGSKGLTSLFRVPDQDVHWTDEDTTSFAITTSEQVITSVALTEAVETSNGSYSFSCQLDNTENKERTVTISARDDGVVVASQVYKLKKNEINRYLVFSGGVNSVFADASIIDFTVIADDTGVNVRGDLAATQMRLTKAQVAAVGAGTINYSEQSTNANGLIEAGAYVNTSAEIPVAETGGIVVVEPVPNTDNTKQTFFGNTGDIYSRFFDGSFWDSWELTPLSLKLNAIAVELTAIHETIDFGDNMDVVPISVTGQNPKRSQIVAALTAIGIVAPYPSSHTIFKDGNKYWAVNYVASTDTFLYEKLTIAN